MIVLGDIFSGPYLLLTITFVIPVALAAWYRGFRFAFAVALTLVVIRIPVAVLVKHATPLPYAIANAVIRLAVLCLVAKLVATAPWILARVRLATTNPVFKYNSLGMIIGDEMGSA